MLRRSNPPSLGVHNLWKVVDPLRIPHSGGLNKLRVRYFNNSENMNNDQTDSNNPQLNFSSTPLRVGVDGNNVLHSLVRQTDLVKLLIHDNPEELCKSCLNWARKANAQTIFGSRMPPQFASMSERLEAPSSNNPAHFNRDNAFRPSRLTDESSTVIASFNPAQHQQYDNNDHRSSSASSSPLQNIHRLLLHDRSTSGILFVFDGETPPSKIGIRQERLKRRERAIAEATVLANYGETALANKLLSQHPSIFPRHLLAVSETLSRAGFPVLHAPFESEAQLSFLAEKGFINCVFSSDSDCLVFHPHSTVLRMRSVFEFDIYDLTEKSGMLKKSSSFALEDAVDANNKTSPSSSPSSSHSSSFQTSQQKHLEQASRHLISDHQKSLLHSFIHETSREIFTFCCIASGSDYNANPGESLPGNALDIFQNIISRFPQSYGSLQTGTASGRRYGLDIAGALLDCHHHAQNHNNSNSTGSTKQKNHHNNSSYGKDKLETTRDACTRLHLPDEIALSLSKAVYSILQHLVYDPAKQKIVPFVDSESVLDLRHYLQELLMKKNTSSYSSSSFSTSTSSSSSFLSNELVDSEIVGRRTPAVPSISDREWCEGQEGVKYRAATTTFSSHRSNPATSSGNQQHQHQHQHQQTSTQHQQQALTINSLLLSSATSNTKHDHQYQTGGFVNQQLHKTRQRADSILFRDEESDDVDNNQRRDSTDKNDDEKQQHTQEEDDSPIFVISDRNSQGVMGNGGFHCAVCDSTFNTMRELEAHLSGKRHEARVKLQKLMNNHNHTHSNVRY